MPFTLVAFVETQSADGLKNHTPVADQHVTVSGDDLTVPELNRILGALAFSSNIEEAQISSPSLRRMFLHDLFPIWTADYLAQLLPPYSDMKENPLTLERGEKMNFLIDNGGNSEYGVGLVWLCDGTPVPAKGEIRTIRATITGGNSAYKWINQALTLSQTLPVGRFAVVGMHVQPGNEQSMMAARLVFKGGDWRPGVMGGFARIDLRPPEFRNGGLGIWGEFESDSPPTVDYMTKAASGTIIIYLDLIQIRSGR